jgi:outer membrane protein TolC
LAELPDPAVPDVDQAISAAEAQSPELKKAILLGEQADRRVDLAKKERWPDVTVSAGVMPRWGGFEPMWTAGLAFNLPVWSAQKQSRAIVENQARGQVARHGAEVIRQLLQQRVRERAEILQSFLESNHLYRSGLLVQSEATVASTLAQYQVGRVSFASILEALAGYVADVNGFYDSVAAAQQIAIAEREISLDAPTGAAGGGMGSPAMPGAGASSVSSRSRSAGRQEGGDSAGSSSSQM